MESSPKQQNKVELKRMENWMQNILNVSRIIMECENLDEKNEFIRCKFKSKEDLKIENCEQFLIKEKMNSMKILFKVISKVKWTTLYQFLVNWNQFKMWKSWKLWSNLGKEKWEGKLMIDEQTKILMFLLLIKKREILDEYHENWKTSV